MDFRASLHKYFHFINICIYCVLALGILVCSFFGVKLFSEANADTHTHTLTRYECTATRRQTIDAFYCVFAACDRYCARERKNRSKYNNILNILSRFKCYYYATAATASVYRCDVRSTETRISESHGTRLCGAVREGIVSHIFLINSCPFGNANVSIILRFPRVSVFCRRFRFECIFTSNSCFCYI